MSQPTTLEFSFKYAHLGDAFKAPEVDKRL